MTRETPQTKAIIGSWRWKYRGRLIVQPVTIGLSMQDWDDLRLLASDKCRTPESVLEEWAKQHIEEWRRS